MELKDTIEGMKSDDYKERFKAEYRQLTIRSKKLSSIIKNYYDLDFEPGTPKCLLEKQYNIMSDYQRLLKVRAEYEGINLD